MQSLPFGVPQPRGAGQCRPRRTVTSAWIMMSITLTDAADPEIEALSPSMHRSGRQELSSSASAGLQCVQLFGVKIPVAAFMADSPMLFAMVRRDRIGPGRKSFDPDGVLHVPGLNQLRRKIECRGDIALHISADAPGQARDRQRRGAQALLEQVKNNRRLAFRRRPLASASEARTLSAEKIVV